jgi:hypothetical protein
MSIRRMMLAIMSTFSDLVKSLIQDIKLRVLLAYGVFEAESCLQTQLDAVNDIGLLQDATIVITPNGYNEDILHTVKGNAITTPYNLAEYTEAFINIQSLGLNNTISTTDINPFGVAKSLRMISNASNTAHRFTKNAFFVQKTSTYTYSVYLKKGSGATAPDVMQLLIQRGGALDVSANFNLITGVTTNPLNCTSSINNTGLTSGWWRCSITLSINASTSISMGGAFCNNNPLAGTSPTYVDATTSDALVFGFQIEDNTSATTYQPVLFTQVLERGYAQHVRSTTGYRVESTGLVREVPQENLLAASENMLLSTVTKTLLTVIPNTEPSPIANSIPMLLNDGTGAGRRRIANSTPILIFTGDELMLSVYAKKAQHDWIQVSPVNANYNTDDWANFNLATGTIGNKGPTATAYIESIGNGWYRCSVLCRAVNNVTQQIDICQSIGNVNGGRYPNLSGTNQNVFYICGNTITRGNTVKPYYPTTLRTNTPRIDYTDGSCPTLLLEQASTNLLLRSEEFNDGGWLKSNITVTSNTDIAPNGFSTADTLTASSSNGFIKQLGAAVNTNVPRIFSVFLKRKTGIGNILLEMGHQQQIVTINSSNWIRCSLLNTALTSTTSISAGTYTVTTSTPHNLVTGDNIRWVNVGTISGSGIPNGVSTTVTVTSPTQYTFTSTVTTATCNSLHYINFGKVIISTSGDEVYAWGAQLELTSTTLQSGYYEPTSYIPTINSAVTRDGDFLHLSKIQENNLLNNTYTLFWEAKKIGGGATNDCYIGLLENYNTVNPNAIFIAGFPISGRKLDNNVGTTLFTSTLYQPSSQNYHRGIITCNNGVFEIWIDGSKLTTTSLVNYQALKLLTLRGVASGITRFKQVLGWNKVLNRAEIDLLFAYPYFNAGYTPVNNELQQIINRANAEGFTIPSTTILGHCDTLITEMKNDGVWNLTDVYFNFAYNNVALANWARINWKNPYGGLGIASLVGAGITYQTNGFKSNGTGSFITTNFNPAIASFNFTQNNAGTMITISQIGTSADSNFSYVYFTNNGTWEFRASATNPFLSMNTSTVWQFPGGTTNRITGTKALMRDTSTNVRRVESATVFTNTITANSFTNSNMLIWNNSNPGNDSCVSQFWVGGSITNTQIQNYRTYYNTYLVNIGLTAFA